MNGKWVISILSVFLLALVAGGWWGHQLYQSKEQLRINLENQYQHSFRELVDDVEKLEVQTAKALVSNSPRQTMINLSDIWRNAYDAQNNLGRLPLDAVALTRTHKFLTQIGDFSYSVAKNTTAPLTLTSGQWTTLHDLYRQANYLSAQLHELEMNIESGRITWTEMERKSNRKLAQVSGNLVNTGFRVIEEEMHNYPTLTYDGPFSDQLRAVPRGIPGNPVTSAQAAEIAREFVVPEKKEQYGVQKIGEANGQIATYSFEVRPRDRGTAFVAGGREPGVVYLDISKKGGEVVWLINNREVGKKQLSFNQALTRAQAFLKSRGYENMVLTSYMEYQRSMIFSFAYQQGNVIIYPDLIKVRVALDNGQILGMEAKDYLMSHRQRDLPEPVLTVEQAKAKLNPRLKVARERLVVIPSESHEEILCYEFLVQMNSHRFLVYINATNGQEQNILRLVEGENLLLAM